MVPPICGLAELAEPAIPEIAVWSFDGTPLENGSKSLLWNAGDTLRLIAQRLALLSSDTFACCPSTEDSVSIRIETGRQDLNAKAVLGVTKNTILAAASTRAPGGSPRTLVR